MRFFFRWLVLFALTPLIYAAEERSPALDGIALIGSTTFDLIQYDALKHQI